jgi:hypothetical protein
MDLPLWLEIPLGVFGVVAGVLILTATGRLFK